MDLTNSAVIRLYHLSVSPATFEFRLTKEEFNIRAVPDAEESSPRRIATPPTMAHDSSHDDSSHDSAKSPVVYAEFATPNVFQTVQFRTRAGEGGFCACGGGGACRAFRTGGTGGPEAALQGREDLRTRTTQQARRGVRGRATTVGDQKDEEDVRRQLRDIAEEGRPTTVAEGQGGPPPVAKATTPKLEEMRV